MSNKKTIKKDLKKINAGVAGDDYFFQNCNYCGKNMCCNMLNRRTVEDGCSSKEEYQCPECGGWNNYF